MVVIGGETVNSNQIHVYPEHNLERVTVLRRLFQREEKRHVRMVEKHPVLDGTRCVQCGICSFNCPISIDVRRHAWENDPIFNSRCLSCGECVIRCPRGVIKFEHIHLPEDDQR